MKYINSATAKGAILLTLFAATLQMSCRKDPNPDTRPVEMAVDAAIQIENPTRAIARTDAFANGDNFGLYIVPCLSSGETAVSNPLRTVGNYRDNVKFSHNGTAFGKDAAETQNANYPNTLTKVDLYAVSPYQTAADLGSTTQYVFATKPDQSAATGADVRASDLMTAKLLRKAPDEEVAALQFTHRLARATFNVQLPAQYKGDPTVTVKKITLTPLATKAKLDLTAEIADIHTDTKADPTSVAQVTACFDKAEVVESKNIYRFEAVVVPQEVEKLEVVFIIVTTKDAVEKEHIVKYSHPDKFTFVAGLSHDMSFAVEAEHALMLGTPAIKAWENNDLGSGNLPVTGATESFVMRGVSGIGGAAKVKVYCNDGQNYSLPAQLAGTNLTFNFTGAENKCPEVYPYAVKKVEIFSAVDALLGTFAINHAVPAKTIELQELYTTKPANCYVTQPGVYILFDARKKAVALNGAATNVVESDVPSTDIAPTTVGIVWQTAANHGSGIPTPAAADMIIQVVMFDKPSGTCLIKPHATGTGNALVAAYDADGTTILWSWHIWVTNGEVVGNVDPGNLANGADKRFMDRNLGALAATTAQPAAADAYKYFGLLWQWGRKEPFTGQGVGEVANTYTKIYKANATAYPDPLGGFTYNNGAAATMMDCIKNPTTHYDSGGSIIPDNPVTWNDNPTIKSIFDPCPYGYRVPINGSWNAWSSVTSWVVGDIKSGSMYQSTWWPAAGTRTYTSAAMIYVAYYAYYWSSSFYSSATDYRSYYLHFNYAGGVYPSGSTNRSGGLSVRCVQE